MKGAASAAVAHSSANEAPAQVDELGAIARICSSVTAEPPAGVVGAAGAGTDVPNGVGVEVGSGVVSVIGARMFIGIVVVKKFVGRVTVTSTWLVLLIVATTVCNCVLVVSSIGAAGAGDSVGAGSGTDVGAGADVGARADDEAGAGDPAAPTATSTLFLQIIPAETACATAVPQLHIAK